MKYKKLFKSLWFWIPFLIFIIIHIYMIYLEYGTIGLIEIIAAFIFDFIILGSIASFLWLISYGMQKTFYRKEKQ